MAEASLAFGAAKFDAISFLRGTAEKPSQSAVVSWCKRQAALENPLLTITKRGDSGRVIAPTLEVHREELLKRFVQRPRPKAPTKRKAAADSAASLGNAGDEFAQQIFAAEAARTREIESANAKYEEAVDAATHAIKRRALAISPLPQST